MSGASAIFILDAKGRVLISRNYRGEVSMNDIAESFQQQVIEQEESQVKPVFIEKGITFCWIRFSNVYLLATTRRDANAALIVSFLYKLVEVLRGYFKELEEESIRDNFVIMYELLDEVMDDGYPQTTELKLLREYITNEAHQLTVDAIKPPKAITNAVCWRSEGVRHKKNEIFLDVVEKLNLLVSANGTVLRSEILGSLKMKSFLSGMPELKLGLNDKLLFEAAAASGPITGVSRSKSVASRPKAIEMDDIKFHQCVRLARFENDRTISFIPPDGEFELLSYRLNTHVKPLIWVDASVNSRASVNTTGQSITTTRSAENTYKSAFINNDNINADFGRCNSIICSGSRSSSNINFSSHMEWVVKIKSQFKSRSVANNVEIYLPLPSDVDSPSFKTSVGSVKYLPDKDVMVWHIKQLVGQKDYIMIANFGLPTISDSTRESYSKRPITVKFEIPYFTVSGITVRYLKIIEKSGYQALPWVRYITQNGDYQLRMA